MPIAPINENPDDPNRKGDEFVRPSVVVGSDGDPLPRITDEMLLCSITSEAIAPENSPKPFVLTNFRFTRKGKTVSREKWVLNGIANLTLSLLQ